MAEGRIAHYEISGRLGAGAMGEVYRARDTKLDREVAIKVLPESFAGRKESLARFEREAKLLASLHHPHIATIFGIEDIEGSKAIILELVEGETLQERLKRGPLEFHEALPVFRQIAEALEAAHEKGIVHRDLKPGNIKFAADGEVKVLDFGLAKAMESASGEDAVPGADADPEAPTLPVDTTAPGMVLGTPAYMSPEQTRGQAVDKRTDVWAFGCCLYEALTGRKPFKAETVSDMMAEVLKSDPDYTIVPVETPADILSLLRRCLDKEPRRRLRDLGDIAIRLEETTETSRLPSPAPSIRPPSSRRAFGRLVTLAAIALAVGLGFLLARVFGPEGAAGENTIGSVAILPFENLKEDQNDWLGEDLADVVREKLGGIDGLLARRGRIPLESYTAAGKSASDAAGELEVDALVVGSIVQHEDAYRVSVSLIRGRDGHDTPLGRFEDATEKVFALENEVALAIAEKIRSDLTADERRRIMLHESVDPGAYAAYRTGLEHFDRAEREEAIPCFEEALKRDPGFLDPMILLGALHKPIGAMDQSFRDGQREVARGWYERAAGVDPEHPRLLAHLAIFEWEEWNFEKAHAHLEAARKADPDNPVVNYARSMYLSQIEARYDEALGAIEAALAVDPQRLLFLNERARIFTRMGNHGGAVQLVERIQSRFGLDWHAFPTITAAYPALGRLDELEVIAREWLAHDPEDPRALRALLQVCAGQGRVEEGRKILEDFGERADLAAALFHAGIGEWDTAFEHLRLSVEHPERSTVLFFRSDNMLKIFGEDLRYWALVDRIGFPELPIGHPFREQEQRMRFGNGAGAEPAGAPAVRSLAILPFDNLKQDEEIGWLSEAMAEAIHQKLGRIDGITLNRRSDPVSSLTREGQSRAEVARDLKVDAFVSGNYVQHEGALQFNVSLTHGADGRDEALGSFQDVDDNLFEIQNKVALKIAEEVRANLSAEERARIAESQGIDVEAYRLFQLGLEAKNQLTSEGRAVAREYFEAALRIDPGYADPVGSLSGIPWLDNLFGGTRTKLEDSLRESEEILARHEAALRQPERLILSRAWLAYYGRRDWAAAKKGFRDFITKMPENVIGATSYGEFLSDIEGRHDDGLEWVERALDKEPDDTGHIGDKANIYFAAGRYTQALAIVDDILRRDPENWHTLGESAGYQLELDPPDPEKAVKRAREAVRISNNHMRARDLLADVLARTGNSADRKEAEEIYRDLREQMEDGIHYDEGWLAETAIALGKEDEALELLRKAADGKGRWSMITLRQASNIKRMGHLPGYWEVVDQLEFPELPLGHPSRELEQKMRFGRKPVENAPGE